MTNDFQSLPYHKNLKNEKSQKDLNCPSVESGPIRSYINDFSKNRDQMIGEESLGRKTDSCKPSNFQDGNSQYRIRYSPTSSVNAPLSRENSTEIVCIERVTIISD